MKKKEMKREILKLREKVAWLEILRDTLTEECDLSLKFIRSSSLRHDEYKRFIEQEMKKRGEMEV